jgi:hypothetical protein
MAVSDNLYASVCQWNIPEISLGDSSYGLVEGIDVLVGGSGVSNGGIGV